MIPQDLFFHKCQSSTTPAGSELGACADKSWAFLFFFFAVAFVLNPQKNGALIIFGGTSPLHFTGPVLFDNNTNTAQEARTDKDKVEGCRARAFVDIPRGL